jgi:hypothetical protein
VELSALLVQAKPGAFSLFVIVLYVHPRRRGDAGEAVAHEADQRAVAESNDGGNVDAVEELPGFGGGQYRGLSLLHDVLRAAHPPGRRGR